YLDNLAGESAADPSLQRELAAAYEKIGDVQGNPYYSNLGDQDGASRSYSRALSIREQLSQKNPTDPLISDELGNAYKNMGDILWGMGKTRDSLDYYLRAHRVYLQLAESKPSEPKYKSRLSEALNGIGHAQEQANNF